MTSSRSTAGLPPHVRTAIFDREVMASVRAVLARADVAVVVLPGASTPEGIDARWVSGVAAVGGVALDVARDLARARAHAASAQLGTQPPDGRGWVLVLDAGQRCAVLALPRGAGLPAQPIDPRINARGGWA